MKRKSRILVVEDEMLISMEIQETLARLGFEVAGQAITGEAAIDEAVKKSPDLILMDIRLQGEMDGIEAAASIKEQLGIPIIFLTAHSDKNTLERAISINPSGYLIKPFNERELFSNIEMALHKARIRNLEKPGLSSLHDRIEKTLLSSRTLCIAVDLQGRITRISPEVRRVFSIERRSLVGSPLSVILADRDESDEPVLFPRMVSLLSDDGERIPALLQTGFILDADHGISEIVFFIHREGDAGKENPDETSMR